MEEEPTQFTQATQNVVDARRTGGQNSGFTDEDISDIICILMPNSPTAYDEVARLTAEGSPHIFHPNDDMSEDYRNDDDASKFRVKASSSENTIILRLSTLTKDALLGYTFGRNSARCDIQFQHDPNRRLSNIHFRIYVNEFGSVMLEDTSTNGTYVDSILLQSEKSKNRRTNAVGPMRTLESGLEVGIALAGTNTSDLRFRVRIPRRDGDYDKAYTQKVKAYLDRIEARRNGVKTVDLFGTPTPQKLRRPLPPETENLPRDWDGSGKYNRVGMIGKGAFAVVYKLTAKFTGEPFAAKELEKRRFMKNGVLDQKIDNEMKIMQKVKHPNIVEYIEHFDWENRLFIIVMEYVPGGDLGKLVNEHGPLDEDVVQTMGAQLLSALGYLHKNNITHRDVKPDNILIRDREPKPWVFKLTDFGLSKMVDTEETFLRTFCGTLLYCAPEVYSEYAEYDEHGRRHPRNRARRQAIGQRYDHAVDIWSLGGVLFYSLASQPPYPVRSGISYSELLHQIMTTNLNTLPLSRQSVSTDGIDFLRRMLHRRPESRATVQELETHPWLAGFGETMRLDAGQSFDEVSDDEALELDASQLSLDERQRQRMQALEADEDDDLQERIEETDEESDKENYTFGLENPPPQQRLFGEVNVSAIGSSGVITQDRLNLPRSDNSFAATEIRDSAEYDSEDSFTPRQKGGQVGGVAILSRSAINPSFGPGQSIDQLQSLVEDVRSQSLGASESVSGNASTNSMAPSSVVSHLAGEMNMSKRKTSSDTSDDEHNTPTADMHKPTIKRLKSENNIDALADEIIEEYRLLACVPLIDRLKSNRQLDYPVSKTSFWETDMGTWHLHYPEMTQLQFDAFLRACQDRREQFGPGRSPMWDLAMKYFPPTTVAAADEDLLGAGEGLAADRRSRLQQDTTTLLGSPEPPSSGEVPSTAPIGEQDDASSTNHNVPRPQMEGNRNVVPVTTDATQPRAVGVIESTPSSIVSDISVFLTRQLVSFGRGPDNTVKYHDRMQVKVPKYAFKVVLWKEGYDASRIALPWGGEHAKAIDQPSDGFAFYISTMARAGIYVNELPIQSRDHTNAPVQTWVKLHDGDEISLWQSVQGTMVPEQTTVRFRCFWGDSAQQRKSGELPTAAVPGLARKLDHAAARAEKALRREKERNELMLEEERELREREAQVERERERSLMFEARRAEAVQYLAARSSPRRQSPATSAPAVMNPRQHHHVGPLPSVFPDGASGTRLHPGPPKALDNQQQHQTKR